MRQTAKLLAMVAVMTLVMVSSVAAYKSEVKSCWNIRITDESYYCFGAVDWPLSEEVYYNASERDQTAKL